MINDPIQTVINASEKLLTQLRECENKMHTSLTEVNKFTTLHNNNVHNQKKKIIKLLSDYANVINTSHLDFNEMNGNIELCRLKKEIKEVATNSLLNGITKEYQCIKKDEFGEHVTKTYTHKEMHHWGRGEVYQHCQKHTKSAQREMIVRLLVKFYKSF